MTFRTDPRIAVRFLRFGAKITGTWIFEPHDWKCRVVTEEAIWWFAIVNNIILMATLILSFPYIQCETFNSIKVLSELMILSDTLVHAILHRVQRRRFQPLMLEVLKYVDESQGHDYQVLRKYFIRYFWFHMSLLFGFVIAILSFVTSPLVMARPFPADVKYPFPTDSPIVKYGLYAHQAITIMQTSGLFMGDLIIVTIILYATARLELLAEYFSKVENETQLRAYIGEHQRLIKYVRETEGAAKYILVHTFFALSIVIVTGSLQLISKDAMAVVSQFSLVVAVACLRMFGSAWPASDLAQASENIGMAVYESSWMEKSARMKKTLTIVIARSQKPLTISYKGVVVLSLPFVASFYYLVITFFMTLKTVVHN